MILLKVADHIYDFCIRSRIRIPKMMIIALPGHTCNAAQEAYVSDSSSDDFVNGLILSFFLKLDAGVPLISISASR